MDLNKPLLINGYDNIDVHDVVYEYLIKSKVSMLINAEMLYLVFNITHYDSLI